MKRTIPALLLVAVSLAMTGCNVGESTAPKPDPSQFLPKDKGGTAGGPPSSAPSAK